MIGEHVERIILRWWRAGMTIQEIQDNTPFIPHDQLVNLIETTRKDKQ